MTAYISRFSRIHSIYPYKFEIDNYNNNRSCQLYILIFTALPITQFWSMRTNLCGSIYQINISTIQMSKYTFAPAVVPT